MSGLLDLIVDWLAGQLLGCLNALFAVITDALLRTPDVTALPQVQALTGRAVWIVDTVFVLAFVAAGVLSMAAGGDERARYTVKDLAPRLVVGFVAAHFAQLACSRLIELANAFVAALAGDHLDRAGALAAIRTHLAAGRDPAAPLLFVVCLAIIVVLLATLACSMLARFVAVLVLTAVAPLALACHALPQTDPAARMWWRAYLGVLAIPVGQALCLTAGRWLLLDPTHLLPVFGLPVEPGGVLNLFIVIVMLWTTVRIPGLVSRFASRAGGGSNVFGAVVRVVVVQNLTRLLPGAGRAVRAARAVTR